MVIRNLNPGDLFIRTAPGVGQDVLWVVNGDVDKDDKIACSRIGFMSYTTPGKWSMYGKAQRDKLPANTECKRVYISVVDA